MWKEVAKQVPQRNQEWPLTRERMMEEVLKEAGNWSTQQVERYTGSCLKMELDRGGSSSKTG